MDAPTITVPVQEIVDTDWIEFLGEVAVIYPEVKGKITIFFENGDVHYFQRDTPLQVRLEDPADEDED